MRVPRVYFVRSLSQATMENPSRFYANRVRARAKVRSDSARLARNSFSSPVAGLARGLAVGMQATRLGYIRRATVTS